MLKNSKVIALICGATSIAATVIFYLMTFDNIFTIPMRWLSLMFLIFTEVVGTLKAFTMKKSIFGISSVITSLFHLGIVLIISIVFVNIFPLYIKTYILLNILALCVLFVVDIIIIHFGEHVGTKNKSLSESQSVMDTLYAQSKRLMIEYQESDYKKDLEEISEMLMYSDNSVLSSDEIVISNKLDELQTLLADNDENTPQKLSEIKNIIKFRSLKIKSIKRGSY